VNSYRNINPGGECAEGIVKEIMEGGPIVGVISYSGFLHAVMLIGGVSKDDHLDEYVIQNSWGTGWEDDGRGLVPISYLVGAYIPVLQHAVNRELINGYFVIFCIISVVTYSGFFVLRLNVIFFLGWNFSLILSYDLVYKNHVLFMEFFVGLFTQ
jgi:hypothetical protein